MISSIDYRVMFEAVRVASRAFRRIQRLGTGVSDRDLARNSDYLDLHRAGMQIALMGGEAAIRSAIDAICGTSARERSTASAELERLWDGLGRWHS